MQNGIYSDQESLFNQLLFVTFLYVNLVMSLPIKEKVGPVTCNVEMLIPITKPRQRCS